MIRNYRCSIAIIKFALVTITLCIGLGIYPITANDILQPWLAKEFLAMTFASLTICFYLYYGGSISIRNPGVLACLVYLCIHPLILQKIDFGNISDNLIYSLSSSIPLVQVLIYFLFFAVVASLKLSNRDLRNFVDIFCWLGVITAVYCFIQFLGYDQFQKFTDNQGTAFTTGKEITGFMGHPNQCGIFLVCTLPFIIFKRDWFKFIIVAIACILTKSIVAIGGALAVSLLYLFIKSNKMTKILISAVALIGLCVGSIYLVNNPGVGSGRIETWVEAWKLLICGPDGNSHFIIGYGFGTFQYLMIGYLGNTFNWMHFDGYQWLFETGIVGLSLLIFSIIWLIRKKYKHIIKDEKRWVFAISLIGLIICSFGSFVFQVEPLRFIGVFLFGFLHQKGELNE
jgi:hypothetical protein